MRNVVVLALAAMIATLKAPSSVALSASSVAHPGNAAYADFNGDGFSDLAVGVPSEDVGAVPDAGAVSVFYGGSEGLQAASPDDQFWNQDVVEVRGVAQPGDQFGRSLAVGDFNADGFSDLAIGVPFEDIEEVGNTDGGAVNVLYGTSNGLQAIAPDDQLWSQESAGVQGSAELDDEFGSALASGDFNGDGFTDLAVGVPKEDVGTVVDAGATNVLYGSAIGLQASAPNDQLISQDTAGVQDMAEASDLFGSSFAGGDFNADGFGDLAIGVPSEDVATIADAGQVSVLYGSATGLQATSPEDQIWNQDSGGVQDSAETGDLFSAALAAGDFNADGFRDLVIGIPSEDVGTIADAGAFAVLYGGVGGLQVDAPDDAFMNQDSRYVKDIAETGDALGSSVAAGDFNSDGFTDVLAGVPSEDVSTIVDAGASAVFYGSATGVQASAPDDQLFSQNTRGIREVSESGDALGASVSAGDFNGDGFADSAFGVPLEDIRSQNDAGGANVVYGSATGLQGSAPDDQFWRQGIPGVQDSAEAGDQFGGSLASALSP